MDGTLYGAPLGQTIPTNFEAWLHICYKMFLIQNFFLQLKHASLVL
jgi:hypothetical protein